MAGGTTVLTKPNTIADKDNPYISSYAPAPFIYFRLVFVVCTAYLSGIAHSL